MYVYINTFIYLYIYMHTYTNIYIYTYICIHIYIHTYTYFHQHTCHSTVLFEYIHHPYTRTLHIRTSVSHDPPASMAHACKQEIREDFAPGASFIRHTYIAGEVGGWGREPFSRI